MATQFICRIVKAGWGIRCFQDAQGRLWVGKGKGCLLEEQIDSETAEDVAEALQVGRGDRHGAFWINRKTRTVTMQVGLPWENVHWQMTY